jgi:hypothetical protein
MLTHGDVVVVLPGMMGSTLVRNRRELWALTTGSILRGMSNSGGSYAT